MPYHNDTSVSSYSSGGSRINPVCQANAGIPSSIAPKKRFLDSVGLLGQKQRLASSYLTSYFSYSKIASLLSRTVAHQLSGIIHLPHGVPFVSVLIQMRLRCQSSPHCLFVQARVPSGASQACQGLLESLTSLTLTKCIPPTLPVSYRLPFLPRPASLPTLLTQVPDTPDTTERALVVVAYPGDCPFVPSPHTLFLPPRPSLSQPCCSSIPSFLPLDSFPRPTTPMAL